MTPDYRTEKQSQLSSDGITLEIRDVHICVECGKQRLCGDWPICPHIKGNGGQQPIEPYFDEHITTEGVWITSRSQRRKIMDQNELEYRPKRTDLLPSTRAYMDLGRRG